jgi:quinol monooxygenase YgiN
MFYESWENKTDLEQHLQKPYIKSFMEKADELLAEPVRISLWEKVDG